ncbi:MAG: hypothetical protein KAI21_00345 [Deltaproteobacteria bacterium]|nr:hypothetical protein [Deltaproteobacteria bacterium]
MPKKKTRLDRFSDLTWNDIKEWAGGKIVSRGKSYQRQGRVSDGWRSQSATKRIKKTVSEIKKAARKDPVLGGEGAVLFLEKGYEEGCTRGAMLIKAQSIQIEPFWFTEAKLSFWVYILQSQSTGRFYCGHTSDMDRHQQPEPQKENISFQQS